MLVELTDITCKNLPSPKPKKKRNNML
jgi:hypothetical protein